MNFLEPKDTTFYNNFSLNCRGKLISLDKPIVMGIVNATPDSFFENSRAKNQLETLKLVEKHLKGGATIIDVGAFSSRPGASIPTVEEELNRLSDPLKAIIKEFPDTIVSIDTFRHDVVKEVLDIGAHMINDISGLSDPSIVPLLKVNSAPYVLMHIQGSPENMQNNPKYNDVTTDVYSFFSDKLELLKQNGVKDIVVDPGFGFGKTLKQNYTLLKNLSHFKNLNLPVLAGVSRKSMIQKVVRSDADESLNGTTAAHMFALMNGANILRAHDAKEARQTISVYNQITNA